MIILTDFPQNFIKSNTGGRSQESPSQESPSHRVRSHRVRRKKEVRRKEEGGRRKEEGGRRKSGSQEVRKAYYIIVFYLHRFQIPIGNFVW
ncbi:MAG: hypothetical protein AN485_12200 [Anabaena sp. MDT14b]|nr:MAG: hypothetical protein AN485_12200 [Anabaena sp. MDT14b]